MSKGFWKMLKEDNKNRTSSQIIDRKTRPQNIAKSQAL
jgi:hypothetical protein